MEKLCRRWIRSGLAGLLALVLCLGAVPTTASASEAGPAEGSGEALSDDATGDQPDAGRFAVGVRRAGTARSASDVTVDWNYNVPGGVEVSQSGGVPAWDVSNTDLRYLEVYVAVNIGSSMSSLEAGDVVVTLPAHIDAGRLVDGERARPACSMPSTETKGLQVTVGPEYVTIRNAAKIQGTHVSVSVPYKIDCWNTVSGERFDVPYTVSVKGDSRSGMLSGEVVTDLCMSMAMGGGSSLKAFANVDGSTVYMQRWHSVYETHFGLTEAEYDARTGSDPENPRYLYDIMRINVTPSGQQPYDIRGEFVPGRYPQKDDSGNYAGYGWDGEVVGAFLAPATASGLDDDPGFIRIEGNTRAADYDSLPGAGDNGTNGWLCNIARTHSWNPYRFEISHEQLDVISSFSDDASGFRGYYLFFLVRFPNSDSIRYQSSDPKYAGYRYLTGTLSLRHTGIDLPQKAAGAAGRAQMYLGTLDDVDYEGNIYSANYDGTFSDAEVSSGMSLLSAGRPASAILLTEFYCLNENRSVSPYETGEYYTLEAMADRFLLSNASGDLKGAELLGAGDYRISDCAVDVIDTWGNNSREQDGSWVVGYLDTGVPDWAGSEEVYVYGSEELYGGDWTLLKTCSLPDVWNGSQAGDVDRGGFPIEGNMLRLKVVYPSSRLTTKIRLRYKIELQPGGPNVGKALEQASQSGADALELTSWLNYTAYKKADYDENYPDGPIVPDLQTDSNDISGDTATAVREWDRQHPYPGYAGSGASPYPYRNVFKTKMKSSSDAAGMTVAQMLFDRSGSLLGGETGKTSFSLVTDAVDISKVVYRVRGVATNYAVDKDNLHTRRQIDVDNGVLSPYTAASQKYYILLPEGLAYAEGSASTGRYPFNDGTGSSGYMFITNVSLPGVGVHVPGGGGCTTSVWQDAAASSTLEIETVMVGNRQLVTVTRPIGGPLPGSEWILPGNFGGYPTYQGWGRGVTVEARPVGDGLPAGNYEALFLHEFLDKDGNPVDAGGFNGEIYTSASEAFGEARGIGIDPHLSDASGDMRSLTAVTAAFRNRSSNGASLSEIKARNGDVAYDDEAYASSAITEVGTGVYNYSLTYRIDNGSSRNVVIWDDIEMYDHNGVVPEWRGIPAGVDVGSTGAVVYVNYDNIDVAGNYVNKASYAWLTDGNHGWQALDGGTDWSRVKAVAFHFKDTTFAATGKNTATVAMPVYFVYFFI